MSHLTSSNDIVFSASTDGTVKKSIRVADSHIFEIKGSLKVNGAPVSVSVGGPALYVL